MKAKYFLTLRGKNQVPSYQIISKQNQSQTSWRSMAGLWDLKSQRAWLAQVAGIRGSSQLLPTDAAVLGGSFNVLVPPKCCSLLLRLGCPLTGSLSWAIFRDSDLLHDAKCKCLSSTPLFWWFYVRLLHIYQVFSPLLPVPRLSNSPRLLHASITSKHYLKNSLPGLPVCTRQSLGLV